MRAWLGPLAVGVVLASRPAAACGGGGVTTPTTASGVVADAQRIVLALHDAGSPEAKTDIVAQIGVPAAGAEYGVLIPVPSTPTIDPEPISEADLDALDQATAPTIIVYDYGSGESDESGTGCGCGSKGDDDSGGPSGASNTKDVTVSAPVNVGPVTAVVIASDDASALTDWLDDNGFAIPDERQSLLEGYVADGYQFIAITRSDTAPSEGPTSLGLHYTLDGDHRQLSLAFARLGAAPKVAFTVFVAAPNWVTPSTGFKTLTLDDLDASVLQHGGYSAAVSAAVEHAGSHAFLLENNKWPPVTAYFSEEFAALLGLGSPPYNLVTRLSTIVAADALDTDVRLDGPYQSAPSRRTINVTANRLPLPRESSAGVLALVLLTRALRRRAQRARNVRA